MTYKEIVVYEWSKRFLWKLSERYRSCMEQYDVKSGIILEKQQRVGVFYGFMYEL